MAGDWIPMRLDLSDDPAVIQIAAALNMEDFAVVGRLHRLWSWANRHLSSCHAAGVTEQWIDRYVSASGFAAALAKVGWLQIRTGSVEFVNFDRWNSQGAKTRALATKRKQAQREGSHEDVTPMSRKERDESVTREEKRREEKKEEKSCGPPPEAGSRSTPAKPRKRNPLFDAIAEITGADPTVDAVGGHIGKVAASLTKAEKPYTPDDVREFGRRFWELCPWAATERRKPNIGEVENHIAKIRNTGGLSGASGGMGRAGRVDPPAGKYDHLDSAGAAETAGAR